MNVQETKRLRQAWFWRWAWLVVALVWPVFAHGCHGGDHDDELSIVHEQRPTLNAAGACTSP